MKDWGEVSDIFEEIYNNALNKELENNSEAQTRFDIIDRIIQEILQWQHGQISVEPHTTGVRNGFIDYELKAGGYKIIIEAKKIGATFPTPTKRKKLKLTGIVLGKGEISDAIEQAEDYAKNREADLVMVTNGNCWCFYPIKKDVSRENINASLLFPFSDINDAKTLFDIFSVYAVENGSLLNISTETPIVVYNKLHSIVDNGDYRIGRNNITDYISPAIDNAILSEALLENSEVLKHCYVTTDSRIKFDRTLNMHLAQYKPSFIIPAKKLKREKKRGELSKQLEAYQPSTSYPVTLLIGSVGSGKSTYLKYYEEIQGKEILEKQNAHWVYLDFEKLGKGGNPRDFIYNELNDYLLLEHPNNPTDYKNLIEPAYDQDIKALARGPYSLLMKNPAEFNKKIIEIIDEDYKKVEPYVEKVYKYLSSTKLCVIVIDNVDLYEDESLETTVFSEAISISKKIKCNIIVSIRDTTFIKHKNDSVFNAHELKKLWLNPPSFREVLSRRLKYAKLILKNKEALIDMQNGMQLQIDDLSSFFTIVQKSLLNEENGKLLEYLSDRNPRKGINLIQNFLSSGHIHADKAISKYIGGQTHFSFPYHEVFKGCMLGQWKYYKEKRSEALNVYESNLGLKNLQFLRLYILKFLHNKAKTGSPECFVSEITESISKLGVSKEIIQKTIDVLKINALIQSNNEHSSEILYNITLCGGYYISYLNHRMVYLEAIMFDTNIFNDSYFQELADITNEIEYCRNMYQRMKLRKSRMSTFMKYLLEVEHLSLKDANLMELSCIPKIMAQVDLEFKDAMSKAKKYERRE